MSTIPLYNALIKAGVDPKDAEAAIEGFARTDRLDKVSDKIEKMEDQLVFLRTDMTLLKWMMGFTLAGIATIIIRTFFA